MGALQVEESYGPDHLNLVIARGYLSSLLRNRQIARYLEQHHDEILIEFRRIANDESTGPGAGENDGA